MADKRPYAKIDTGYLMNPKWFKIERALRIDERIVERSDIRSLVRVAREAHIASILYCAQNVTDGEFPVDAVKSMTMVRHEEEPAITALFTVGLWVNEIGGMARVHDYLEHQTSSAKIKQMSDAGKAAAEAKKAKSETNRSTNRETNRSTNRSTEEKRREEKDIAASFEAWYALYPKKVARGDAFKAYKAALKKTTPEELLEGVKRYVKITKNTERKFIKNPGPWLRDEKWTDEDVTDAAPSELTGFENYLRADLDPSSPEWIAKYEPWRAEQ